MKKIALLNLIALLSTGMYSQNILDTSRGAAGGIDVIMRSTADVPVEGAIGSPYVMESFAPAKINQFQDLHVIRYNAASDAMEFKNRKNEILVLNKMNDYTITLNGSNKIYQTVTYSNGKRGYAVLLWKSDDSNTSLFLRERIEFVPKKPAASSYSKDQPAKYKRVKDVLYLKDGSEMTELPTNKKKFFAAFKGKEKEVQQFVKKNKLKISKQEDIVKIIEFYSGE
ncbi:hypothetical protein GWK08_13385 [Leptobacterium flavescens]|uniref:Uncharacterized protein n=1 Tax=Leptobacterium flavescens TaxID=472055 RepID=A0A6P0UM71_9FLAO|nr:hypothetical protein [Leptobacterium flavescens]NER14441.1 hypothetical protein [Leptobacterium flavescens]